jgi:hypothetical protein
MLRISFLAILLLTSCENKQAGQNRAIVGQTQIESPLQNTAEGMAEAKPKGSISTPASVNAVSHASMPGTTAGPARTIR